MNYLSRPVFVYPIDWSRPVNHSVTYDLRETLLGFGAEFFFPTETYTVNGWTATVELYKDADLFALDLFFSNLYGRLNGFWLPVPFESFRIIAAINSTSFKIANCNLTSTWNSRPDVHLLFDSNPPAAGMQSDGSGNWQAAAITSVVDNHDGTETVTIGTALSPAPSTSMFVRRLHYVRLAADVEKGTFIGEGTLDRELNVIELPLEYTTVETGQQPIYLYAFTSAAPVSESWYYTSFAVAVWSNGIEYLPFPMSHGAISQTAKGDKDDLQIEAKADPSHPFSLFFPAPFPAQMQVTVNAVQIGAPNTQTLLFSGIVRVVEDQGNKYVAHCSSPLYLLDRKVPRMLIQPTCNYALFDPNTCKVIRAQYETTIVVVSVSVDIPPTVVCTFLFGSLPQATNWKTANWFAGGIWESGSGTNFEPRTIVSSSWNSGTSQLTLVLNMPVYNVSAAEYCQITAGCDGATQSCTQKFNNYPNFGGFPAVPERNLTLEAFNNLTISQGGKK